MSGESNEQSPYCAKYQHTVELIGRRWTGAILRALMSGVTRFSDICETVPGLSDRMLAERLKELEHEKIVLRTVWPETPVRVEYSLTAKGHDLSEVVGAVSVWADRWQATTEVAPTSG